ncbi:MAG: hypothetical protein ACK4UN_02795 [Limisphaerales bacterium]
MRLLTFLLMLHCSICSAFAEAALPPGDLIRKDLEEQFAVLQTPSINTNYGPLAREWFALAHREVAGL